MKRLSKQEIEDRKAALAEWQSPEAMLALTRVHAITFHRQSGLAFLRDARIASWFATARNASHARLVSEEWPDFQLRFGERNESFEAVEADDPKRRRGLEYTEDKMDIPENVPIADIKRRALAAPEWVRAACERKVAKHYAARAGLVIYLNLGAAFFREEVQAHFHSATKVAHGAFPSVWILWQGKAYQVYA